MAYNRRAFSYLRMILTDALIQETMQEVIDLFLIPKFEALGMNASGNWLRSLEAKAENGIGYINGADYTYYLAYGRKPGKMPPVEPLIKWVTAKLGVSGREGKSIAWAVAKKIAAEGTEYFPAGTDLLAVLQSPEVTAYINNKFESFLTEAIKIQVRRQLDIF